MREIVDLGKEYARILTSRDLVRDIEERYDGNVILDFKNVEFISRSFAHELWLYMHRHKEVEIVNTNKDIENMINAVKHSIENGKRNNKLDLPRKNILSVIYQYVEG